MKHKFQKQDILKQCQKQMYKTKLKTLHLLSMLVCMAQGINKVRFEHGLDQVWVWKRCGYKAKQVEEVTLRVGEGFKAKQHVFGQQKGSALEWFGLAIQVQIWNDIGVVCGGLVRGGGGGQRWWWKMKW